MLCILCYNHPQAPGAKIPASFVVNGLSVCIDHVQIARGESNDYSNARKRLIEAETAKNLIQMEAA
jgi:hypothetical protein